MKVAVISDIHGNLHALDPVLASFDQEQPDQIVCLGDFAALGPHPAEVVARLREIACPFTAPLGRIKTSYWQPRRRIGSQRCWLDGTGR